MLKSMINIRYRYMLMIIKLGSNMISYQLNFSKTRRGCILEHSDCLIEMVIEFSFVKMYANLFPHLIHKS